VAPPVTTRNDVHIVTDKGRLEPVRLQPRVAVKRDGRAVFGSTVVAFVAIAAPLVWRGAPLADDFNNCVAPVELGLDGFMAASWRQLGAIRPGRFLEILLAAGVCRSLPFGVAIVVPLLLTLVVAYQARGTLRDIGTPPLWANIGGALWLLQPLGTEAALWPAALHIPLGLALALTAIRLYHRRRYGWAALANLGAALCVEQVILPLSLAAWLVAPVRERRRAAVASGVVAAGVIAGFLLWPGANPRLRTGLMQRIVGLADDPSFYVGFPAVGLGLHSIPLAIRWALPWSLAVLAVGAGVGWLLGVRLAAASRPVERHAMLVGLLAFTALIILGNLVVVFAVPQQGSPRVFAPTWLMLAIGAGAGGASVKWRHPRPLGMAGGLFAGGAVLSLMFSVSVRLHSADFTERAVSVLAAKIADGSRVAICGVRRTVVQPAPRGAFAVHEFIYEWSAERALTYYTGRHATIFLSGELWNRPCPPVPDVDAVIDFNELLAAARP
jgi:hypothetical protein